MQIRQNLSCFQKENINFDNFGQNLSIGSRIIEQIGSKCREQALAELGQAQVKLDVVDEVFYEVQLQWKLEFTSFSVGWVSVLDEIKARLNRVGQKNQNVKS